MVRTDLQGRSFIDSIKEEVAPIYPAYVRRPMVFSPDGYSRIPDLNSFTIDPRWGYRSFKQVCRNATLMVVSCLEWKSGRGGVQGWKLLEGFGMEGILRQKEGCYQLIFAGQISDSR